MMEKVKKWCASNTASAKCTRTIAQGIVGALVVYGPDLITGSTVIPAEYKPLAVACVMAILSPIQAQLGKCDDVPEGKHVA